MILTEKEKKTVYCVLDDLLKKPYSELNTFIGSETIKDMMRLHSKLKYEWYEDKYGVKYEDMTEDDFIRAHEEMYERTCEMFEDNWEGLNEYMNR